MRAGVWLMATVALAVPTFGSAADTVGELASPDVAVRRKAIARLAEDQTVPPDAVAPLVGLLEDRDYVVCDMAVRALGHSGAPARTALEPLLGSPDASLRSRAARALARLAGSDPDAWPLVLRAFGDENESVRGLAADVAGTLGAPALPWLTGALADPNAGRRAAAARALRGLGANAQPAARALVRALQDGDRATRREAALALAKIDPKERAVIAPLIDALPDLRAIDALATLAPPPAEAIPALVGTLAQCDDVGTRERVATAFRRIGVGEPTVSSALVAALGDPDSLVRSEAASTLGVRRDDAPDVVPALVHTLGDDEGFVRMNAGEALAKIGEPAVPALLAALASADVYVRQEAARALDDMRPYPAAATDALIRALDDSSDMVRVSAASALRRSETQPAKDALARYEAARQRMLEVPPSSPDRIVSKEDVIATRPSDSDHRYPLELQSLVPIDGTDLVVSTHRSREGTGEMVVWAKVPGGYRRLESFVDDEPELASHAPVRTFRHAGDLFLFVSLEYSGTAAAHEDTLFVVEQSDAAPPTLTPVEIESPVTWFHDRLGADESVNKGIGISLTDERLAWSFGIWGPGDANCCPTAGRVEGTFAIRKDERYDDDAKRWETTWRMVVRDGKRRPIE